MSLTRIFLCCFFFWHHRTAQLRHLINVFIRWERNMAIRLRKYNKLGLCMWMWSIQEIVCAVPGNSVRYVPTLLLWKVLLWDAFLSFSVSFLGCWVREKKNFVPKTCSCVTALQLCKYSKIISMNGEVFDCLLLFFFSLISCGFWKGFPLGTHLFGKRWTRVLEAHLEPSCVRSSRVPPWSRTQEHQPWHQPDCFSGCTFNFNWPVSEVWIEHRMCICSFFQVQIRISDYLNI